MHPSLATGDSELPQTFAELRLHSKVVSSLSEMRIVQPTTIQVSGAVHPSHLLAQGLTEIVCDHIQILAIPKILRGQNLLVGAETGSGKTLSYLAPIVSQIKMEEETEGVVARLRRPRALVVAPSRVLAQQILVRLIELCTITASSDSFRWTAYLLT